MFPQFMLKKIFGKERKVSEHQKVGENKSIDAEREGLEKTIEISRAVITLPEILPPVETVHSEVKDLVNKIIYSDDDSSRVSHLFRELIKLHDIKGKITTEATNITIKLQGELKKDMTLEKICLEILREFPKSEYNRKESYIYKEILFKHFAVKLRRESYPTQLEIVIKITSSIGETELNTLKEVFEKSIIENSNFASNIAIDEDFLVDRLNLKESDIVILEEKKLKIKKFCEENTVVNFREMLDMINNITSNTKFNEKWFVHIQPEISRNYGSSDQFFHVEITSEHISHGVSFNIIIDNKSISYYFEIENNNFNRKFFTDFFVPFFKEMQQLVTTRNQESIAEYLQKMGVHVKENSEEDTQDLNILYTREGFVGYEDIKEHIENGIIHAWKNKKRFEEIAHTKYRHIKDIVPNAVLFEGPPGTGKTTLARIIGSHLNYPFVYIPLNSFMSKWYGEAEKRLSNIFEKIGELASQRGGVVIMIDEIDEIGGDREKNHEATGKITGVLLKKLDGMERIENILLIGATNRKEVLDSALISRFKYSQFFRLPNESEISKIVSHYLKTIGSIPESTYTPYVGKISGRNIKNICEDTARLAIQKEINGEKFDLTEIFLTSLKHSIES